MAKRTYNRNLLDVGLDYYEKQALRDSYFNINEFKGICTNKNYVGIDQQTFADANNVYVDQNDQLSTRPPLSQYQTSCITALDSVLRIDVINTTTFYHVKRDESFYLVFCLGSNIIEYNVKDKILLTTLDDNYIVFMEDSAGNASIMAFAIDLINNTSNLLSTYDYIHVPTVKMDGERNILTTERKEVFTIKSDENLPAELIGKTVQINIGEDTYSVTLNSLTNKTIVKVVNEVQSKKICVSDNGVILSYTNDFLYLSNTGVSFVGINWPSQFDNATIRDENYGTKAAVISADSTAIYCIGMINGEWYVGEGALDVTSMNVTWSVNKVSVDMNYHFNIIGQYYDNSSSTTIETYDKTLNFKGEEGTLVTVKRGVYPKQNFSVPVEAFSSINITNVALVSATSGVKVDEGDGFGGVNRRINVGDSCLQYVEISYVKNANNVEIELKLKSSAPNWAKGASQTGGEWLSRVNAQIRVTYQITRTTGAGTLSSLVQLSWQDSVLEAYENYAYAQRLVSPSVGKFAFVTWAKVKNATILKPGYGNYTAPTETPQFKGTYPAIISLRKINGDYVFDIALAPGFAGKLSYSEIAGNPVISHYCTGVYDFGYLHEYYIDIRNGKFLFYYGKCAFRDYKNYSEYTLYDYGYIKCSFVDISRDFYFNYTDYNFRTLPEKITDEITHNNYGVSYVNTVLKTEEYMKFYTIPRINAPYSEDDMRAEFPYESDGSNKPQYRQEPCFFSVRNYTDETNNTMKSDVLTGYKERTFIISENLDYVLSNTYLFDGVNTIDLINTEKKLHPIFVSNTERILYVDELNVLYDNNYGVIEIELITAGNLTPIFMDMWLEGFINVYAKNNKLYINTKLEKGKLYLQAQDVFVFNSNVTALCTLSTNSIGVFLENEMWILTQNSDGIISRTKSKLGLGVKNGSNALSVYDGSVILLNTLNGLASLGYENFVQSTDQIYTYLSDNVYAEYTDFCKDAVILYQYKNWIFAYKNTSNRIYLYDMKRQAWWHWTVTNNVKQIIYNNEVLLLLLNNHVLYFDLNAQEFKDYGDTFIDWKIATQRLHFGAPNNYKHLRAVNVIGQDEVKLRYGMRFYNYRNVNGTSADDVVDFEIESLNNCITRVGFIKTNAFQIEFFADKTDESPTKFIASNISVKYRITENVR